MSYEIVKSINEKEMSIVSADSSLYPRRYRKWKRDCANREEFIKTTLVDLAWGNLHYNNPNHKYSIVVSKLLKTPEYKGLEEKIWNWNKTYTEEWHKEHYEENYKALKDLAFKIFNEPIIKGKYILGSEIQNSYLVRMNRRTYRSCSGVDRAKVYKTIEAATIDLNKIPSSHGYKIIQLQ